MLHTWARRRRGRPRQQGVFHPGWRGGSGDRPWRRLEEGEKLEEEGRASGMSLRGLQGCTVTATLWPCSFPCHRVWGSTGLNVCPKAWTMPYMVWARNHHMGQYIHMERGLCVPGRGKELRPTRGRGCG